MKIFKINDDLKINLDAIYSIQHISNTIELENFEKLKLKTITEAVQNNNLPEFEINGEYYKPDIQDIISGTTNEQIQTYYIYLNNYYNDILSKPEEKHEYYLFLSTGAKISIDKSLYDVLNNELEKFVY